MSSSTQAIGQAVGRLIDDFIRRGKRNHKFPARFLASWWGTFVLHFAMMVIYIGNSELATLVTPFGFLNLLTELPAVGLPPDLEPLVIYYGLVISAMLLAAAYSCIFALIVAVGVPQGSLMRHFWYGVILPVIAYTMAGTLWKGLTNVGG